MSGSKRRSPYRKVVTDGVLYGTPELGAGHRIAVAAELCYQRNVLLRRSR